MEKYEQLLAEAKKGGFNLKEFVTRSEGPQLFTTAINDKLIQGLQPELPAQWQTIYDEITIDRRDINFPSIRGLNPDYVPELAEFKFADPDFTETTVTPLKFGMRFGQLKGLVVEQSIAENSSNSVNPEMGIPSEAAIAERVETRRGTSQVEEGIVQTTNYLLN